MVLTKSEILNGKKDIQEVKIESLGDTIQLRPLTQQELFKREEISSKAMGKFKTNEKANRSRRAQGGTQMESTGEIDIYQTTLADQKARVYMVQQSLSIADDKWSENDVKSLSGAVFDEIYENVLEINHLNEDEREIKQDVENFPSNE